MRHAHVDTLSALHSTAAPDFQRGPHKLFAKTTTTKVDSLRLLPFVRVW